MTATKPWNHDPLWHEYIESLDPAIQAIAAKYTDDVGLREDAAQEARIELLHIFPQDTTAYNKFARGEISEERYEKQLASFCKMVVRNTILTMLNSYKTGPWRVGRKVKRVGSDGQSVSKRKSARFASMDDLVEDFGLQIDTDMNISWPDVKNPTREDEWE